MSKNFRAFLIFKCDTKFPGHVMAKLVQAREEGVLDWYNDELLHMAAELADRLLPAFNTTSGIPYSRVSFHFLRLKMNKSRFIKWKKKSFGLTAELIFFSIWNLNN